MWRVIWRIQGLGDFLRKVKLGYWFLFWFQLCRKQVLQVWRWKFYGVTISMFDCVNPASRGLVSVAPKKTIPMMVVSQSIVPIRMSVVQNKTSFLTTIHPLPFSNFPYNVLVKGSVNHSECWLVTTDMQLYLSFHIIGSKICFQFIRFCVLCVKVCGICVVREEQQ